LENLLDMTPEQLAAEMEALGQPEYRADQLMDWVYRKGVTDPAKMTNVAPAVAGQLTILTSRVVQRSDSIDGTTKLLVELQDKGRIECVLIPTETRATACLSTQVGCGMGCTFCASGTGGLERNLTVGEMLEELLHLRGATGRRITHVVFMGMGEPLANYEGTVGAIRAIIDPRRFGISARHVTVSTVGLPKQIRRLASENLPITLAISLHAPNDALRRQLIPSAGRFPIDEILAAAQGFFQARKREVTLEYVLLAGLNDTNVCAEALARIARRLRCNVNLIRYNPAGSLPYRRPSQAAVQAFADRLTRRGVNVHARRSRGLDAEAACGQLRRRSAATPETDEQG
jgi:23S rRNA (adenine2503-C2)-methyltransferase